VVQVSVSVNVFKASLSKYVHVTACIWFTGKQLNYFTDAMKTAWARNEPISGVCHQLQQLT